MHEIRKKSTAQDIQLIEPAAKATYRPGEAASTPAWAAAWDKDPPPLLTVPQRARKRGLPASRPRDPAEQEADRVAEWVIHGPPPYTRKPTLPAGPIRPSTFSPVRAVRETYPGAQPVLRRNSAAAGPLEAPASVHQVIRSPGQSLDLGTRAFMEGRFGYDFSGVRIHTDSHAAASARAVHANAYAVGEHIVFGQGQYAPASPSGQRLLAHELSHVVQGGPLVLHRDGPDDGGPSVSMPSLTTFLFQYRGASLRVALPTSVTATLPVDLRNVGLLTFSLSTDIPNNFSFTVSLNTRRHLRIATRFTYNRETGRASAGLVVETTRTTCTVPNPETVQRDLQAAGDRLTSAIQNFVNPPAVEVPQAGGEGPSLPPEIDRARELGTAIYELYDRAQRATTRCVTQPVWSFEFGVQGPLTQPVSPPPMTEPGALPPATFVGASATFHF